ncbi:hypothetical protein CWI37_1534p0010 [Hamiltosporidium tvaerminnensis]|uniref:Uncharacterized protein n=1 Tax=Hamiltosporidium tvaerminnensis TaxID=1176355 RepID=A0A4Q9KX18_9MICR|nr:hypothetical protein CWI37_1534p0010 [Hamiltosporidium tvaerminnensis]
MSGAELVWSILCLGANNPIFNTTLLRNGAKICYFRSQDVGGTNNPLEQMGNEKYGVKILVQKVCTHRVSVRNYSGK